MTKILALDVGDRYTGVALGDSQMELAFPRDAIDCNQVDIFKELKKTVEQESITRIVVGLPLNADGSKNDQCHKVEKFAKKLKDLLSLPIDFVNEYASTLEAEQRFRYYDQSKNIKKGMIDSTAALIILETYFKTMKLNE